MKKRLIVAISGATGSIYGIRILEQLRALGDWESHLILSDAGVLNVWQEQGLSRQGVNKLADVVHNPRNIAASVASGSFITEGMVIAPCSMKTLAGVALAYSDNLITRAADVVLKERRRLVLLVRETPLTLAHLRNMVAVTEMGGIVFPPLPSYYAKPATIDEVVNYSVARVLDLFAVHRTDIARWHGIKAIDLKKGAVERE